MSEPRAQCAACRQANPAGSSFCLNCGSALTGSCPRCGAELPAGARFCNRCGTSQVAPVAREPRGYTPPHLVDKILASRAAVEGERKPVTVLFADVKGSMEIAGGLDPEEWHRVLDRFFRILTDGVHRFEGTVNQYTGDGIMALFGAPIAHEDHAQRACWAALHLRDGLRRYADALRLDHGVDFSVRMGLNSGEVVVGRIGDDLRMDYTAQGPVVGLAQRMEQIAGADRVCLGEETARLVRGYFALRDLGPARVKGVAAPVGVFELEGPGPMRTRFDLSRARGLSRFVGREREIATLEAALERAVAGNGQMVGLVADAGTGKSRLSFEFLERCRGRDVLVRETRGVAHGRAVPLLPVLEFYRSILGITDRDDDRTARQKIAGSIVQVDETLLPSLPVLYDFLGVPDPERPAPAAPPEDRQREVLALLKRLTLARSRREPAVILFEDLHWIDPATEIFLENLVDAVDGSRTLLLVNFRPEYQASWMSRSYYQQVALAPLDERALGEMLGDFLGSHPSVTRLAARIHARTAGNPFFAEEILQSLVDAGALRGPRGKFELVRDPDALELPTTVQAVLAARIDRLDERDKGVLQTAAVIGREFAEPLLRQIAGLESEELMASLRTLVRAEFLCETALYPEVEYAFKHPLTQEVAYGSQLRERRARVHAAAAQALASSEEGKLDERAALIAHHWEQAGDALEAARWQRRAALWTLPRDIAESFARWRKVVELLGLLPATPETVALGARARAQLLLDGTRLSLLSPSDVDGLFHEGIALAAQSGDDQARGQMLFVRGFAAMRQRMHEDARRLYREAIEIADRVGDPAVGVSARHLAGVIATDAHESVRLMREALAVARGRMDLGRELWGVSSPVGVHGHLTVGLTQLGRLREAREVVEKALVLLRDHYHTDTEFMVRTGAGSVAMNTGDGAAALDHARRSVAAMERSRNIWLRGFAYGFLSDALAMNHRYEDALTAARHCEQLASPLPPLVVTNFAHAHLGMGDVQAALARAEEAIALGRELALSLVEARGRVLRARALVQIDARANENAVLDEIGRAERLFEQHLPGLRPIVHEVRAALAAALGDGAMQDRELRRAHARYVEMEATGHAERIARELLARAGSA